MQTDGRQDDESTFVKERTVVPSDPRGKEVINLPPWPGEIKEVREQKEESPGN